MGEYTEELALGGKLNVTKSSWHIEYYFPGPDLRYNGEFIRIPGASVDSYISAFEAAWAEYKQLKTTLPAGGQFSKTGRNGVYIRVGGYSPGVSLHSYRAMVSSDSDLSILVKTYEGARQRAAAVQAALASLPGQCISLHLGAALELLSNRGPRGSCVHGRA